jgi:hypothetical protein
MAANKPPATIKTISALAFGNRFIRFRHDQEDSCS